ncbi:uncharacterized protein RCO7_14490 [Rhynchosporium graminicola]|uniref:Uncharacterized protein n=1 Tax=Rhynchosporium graminicola TaxID=2792576 RepID=A0A1E1KK68_9HELO|nr:uncharacterized protein RCO7_14490 [Rhynchosporium commune]
MHISGYSPVQPIDLRVSALLRISVFRGVSPYRQYVFAYIIVTVGYQPKLHNHSLYHASYLSSTNGRFAEKPKHPAHFRPTQPNPAQSRF